MEGTVAYPVRECHSHRQNSILHSAYICLAEQAATMNNGAILHPLPLVHPKYCMTTPFAFVSSPLGACKTLLLRAYDLNRPSV